MKYIKRSFEDFLRDIYARNYRGTDDDMSDGFDKWLVNKQVDYLLKYADLYGEERYIVGKEDMYKKIAKKI